MFHKKKNLDKQLILPGGDAIVERSYPVGRKNYFRLKKSESLNLSIKFDETQPKPDKVCVHFENFSFNKSRTKNYRLKGKEWSYQVEIPLSFFGATRFKIKYRLKHKWYWDRRPFSYFIADPDELRDLRIYTFIPNVSGHIGDWAKELYRIKDLGFNMIHLLPVTHMSESESPYAAYDLFSLDQQYIDHGDPSSPKEQLEKYVDLARQLNMRLCFDLVFNNIGVKSRMCQMRPEWLTEDPDEEDGIRRGGWHDGRQWHKWRDLAFINYDIPCSKTRDELWNYMKEYALYWSGLAAKTGGMIRLDNLHSSHEQFMRWVLGKIRKEYPELIVWGELFESEEVIEDKVFEYGLSFLLATPWEHKFVPQLRDYIKYTHRKKRKLNYIFPINSHDSLAPAQEFGDVMASVPRLVVSALMGPGPSGLTQGVEFGIKEKLKFIGRQDKVVLQENDQIVALIKELNALIEHSSVVQQQGNLEFVDSHHHAVMAACRVDKKRNIRMFVAVNMDIRNSQQISISFSHHNLSFDHDCLHHALGEAQCDVSDSRININFMANQYCVFVE